MKCAKRKSEVPCAAVDHPSNPAPGAIPNQSPRGGRIRYPTVDLNSRVDSPEAPVRYADASPPYDRSAVKARRRAIAPNRTATKQHACERCRTRLTLNACPCRDSQRPRTHRSSGGEYRPGSRWEKHHRAPGRAHRRNSLHWPRPQHSPPLQPFLQSTRPPTRRPPGGRFDSVSRHLLEAPDPRQGGKTPLPAQATPLPQGTHHASSGMRQPRILHTSSAPSRTGDRTLRAPSTQRGASAGGRASNARGEIPMTLRQPSSGKADRPSHVPRETRPLPRRILTRKSRIAGD